MAIVRPIDPNAQAQYEGWIASRPPVVQDLIRRYPPDRLYRLNSDSGRFQRVTIYSYAEDGTVTVNVDGEYNFVLFGRRVYGIDPADLTECDLPNPNELVGDVAQAAGITIEELVGGLSEVRRRQQAPNN